MEGQRVTARFEKSDKGELQIVFDHFVKNTGTGPTDPMYVKVYSKKPLQLDTVSTDEKQYDYETVIDPSKLEPNRLPGGLSIAWTHLLVLASGVRPPPGEYPALLKIYYGKAGVVQNATFACLTVETRQYP